MSVDYLIRLTVLSLHHGYILYTSHDYCLYYISFTLDACCEPHIVLGRLSTGYPMDKGRLDTRYSPVRRSPSSVASNQHAAPRLACVKPVASVHPEPGSNSTL